MCVIGGCSSLENVSGFFWRRSLSRSRMFELHFCALMIWPFQNVDPHIMDVLFAITIYEYFFHPQSAHSKIWLSWSLDKMDLVVWGLCWTRASTQLEARVLDANYVNEHIQNCNRGTTRSGKCVPFY